MNLSALAGNGALKAQLSAAQRLPHALILSGPAGSGKRTLAALLAQAFVCAGEGERPCGRCRDCRLVREGTHPDVVPIERFLTTEERERPLKVDAVRALRADAYIRPNQAARKVYLIARADTMNPSAQNALLKVLEDGPDYAAFLLLAENPLALLETIRSRCVRYALSPVSGEEAIGWLRARHPDRDPEALARAAAASGGWLGRAEALLEEDGAEDPRCAAALDELRDALAGRSERALMEWSVRIQNGKWTREQMARLYPALAARACDALAGRDAPWRAALSPAGLSALARLAREGERAMAGNVSPAHSAGWLAASAAEILRRHHN